jgi:hypothetical protein
LLTAFIVALALSLGADGTTKQAQPQSEKAEKEAGDFAIETKRQQIPLANRKSIRIINHLGDVRARNAKGSELNVISVIQRFKKSQTDAKTLIKTEGKEIEITTAYPSAVKGATEEGLQGRIDLSLLVPYGADLTIETKDGFIEVKKVQRRIDARSESGRIRISTGRRLSAHSDSGKLGITLGSPTKTENARVSSVTGDIHVDFSNSPMPSITAQTKGKITEKGIGEEPSQKEENPEIYALKKGTQPGNLQVESQEGNIFLRALTPRQK